MPRGALQIPDVASADVGTDVEKKVWSSKEASASWKEKVDKLAEEEENECGTTAKTRTEEATSRMTRGSHSGETLQPPTPTNKEKKKTLK
ncbi:hypothetical protein NDU88_006124 [Pleurodeles waltl]|uniref:Uncharacterized protein n=1 Tax=Pleurodeles waltl TaxID=8319 RepID=A0AAV7PHF7_PLEWA|nr:hypothetical protein NDU88_006124 [Pleurodeles waltl]